MEPKNEGEEQKPAAAVVQPEEKKEESGVDWKAEKEALEKRISQADHTIINLKKKKDEGEVDIEALRAEALADAERIAQEKIDAFKVEQATALMTDLLSEMIQDPDKRAMVELIYDKRIQKSGSSRSQIMADIKAAELLADQPRLEKKFEEIKKAQIADQSKSGGSSAGQDIGGSVSGLTDAEEATVKEMAVRKGISVEAVRALFIKNKAQTNILK